MSWWWFWCINMNQWTCNIWTTLGPERRTFLWGRWKCLSRDEDRCQFRNRPQGYDGWIHVSGRNHQGTEYPREKRQKGNLKMQGRGNKGRVIRVIWMVCLRGKWKMQGDRDQGRKVSGELTAPEGISQWFPVVIEVTSELLNSSPTYWNIKREKQCGFFKRNLCLIL